jgi:hypothetical protein
MEYTDEELRECLKKAFSYENRAGHKKDGLSIALIGTVRQGNKLVEVYEDTERNYWYLNKYRTDRGIVSEYEYIFGHPEKVQKGKRKLK